MARDLLVNPVLRVAFPVQDFTFFEPKSDFLLGVFDGVTSVADVASNFNTVVPSDGSGGRFKRVGGSQHLTSGGNSFLSFPDHADNRAALISLAAYADAKNIVRSPSYRKVVRFRTLYRSVVRFILFLPQHVISQLGEERLLDKIAVVSLKKLLGGLLGLHGSHLVSLGFESADDVSDDSSLNTIGLDLLSLLFFHGEGRMWSASA